MDHCPVHLAAALVSFSQLRVKDPDRETIFLKMFFLRGNGRCLGWKVGLCAREKIASGLLDSPSTGILDDSVDGVDGSFSVWESTS